MRTRPPTLVADQLDLTRRDFLGRMFNGFGSLALGNLLTLDSLRAAESNPLAVRPAHRPRRAKHCIFLFMSGGVSQMDSFEYKPVLNQLHGQPIPHLPNLTAGELQGRLTFPHACVGSPFQFRRHGQSGRYLSELLPHLARHVDDLAFMHGIQVDNQNHACWPGDWSNAACATPSSSMACKSVRTAGMTTAT